MSVYRVRRWGAGAGLGGGVAVVAAMLGAGFAHADTGTDQINGWTVTPTGGSDSGTLLPPAMLSDPSDSLGLGTAPITGGWLSAPATPLSSIGSNDEFAVPFSVMGSPNNLFIQDNWLPGVELASVQTGKDNEVLAFLVPAAGDKYVVDLVNLSAGDAPPLFNPDATGPIDIGGVQLVSPHDGALLNGLSDALFKGDAADFGKATTLFDDLLGINPLSAATAHADPTHALDVAGSAVAASSAHDAAVSAWDAAANNALASSSPDDLLSQASANLAEASSLIATAPEVSPLAVLNLFGIIGGAVEAGFGQGIAQGVVDELPGAEAAISAHDGSLSTQVDQLFFEPLNQDWEHTSEALLHADQAYEAAVTSGSGLDAADSSLFTADLQALGDAFDSAPVIDAANLINIF